MSKQSSDQRSYSVDEMMEKLKEGEREKRRDEDSELVTRPDGSKVVRIRRRKRRSKQPQKERSVRFRRSGIIFMVLFAVVLVAGSATVLILLARYNSKGYRDELKERVLSASGASVGLTDLTVTPFKVRARSLQFVWPTSGVAKSLKLTGLSAELGLGSLFGADWNGKEATAESGVLLLGPPDGTISHALMEGELPFDFGGYRCPNLEMIYGEQADKPALHLTGAEVTMRPMEGGGVQFLVNGGRARVGGWDELRIDHGLAEWRGGALELVSLRAHVGKNGGEATLRGTKPIRSGTQIQCQVELKNFPLDHMLGSSSGLGRLIGGDIQAPDGTFTADPRFMDSGKLRVEFSGLDGTLKHFQFLKGLSTILGKTFYDSPDLGRVKGVFRQDKDGMRLHEFEFEAKSQLKILGYIDSKPDGELQGTIRVGVPQGLMMRTETQRRYAAFSQPELGYCWINIKLSGTVDHPLDDFLLTLKKGAEKTTESGGNNKLLEENFDRLTR